MLVHSPTHLSLKPPQRLLIAGTDCLSTTVAFEHGLTGWNRVGRADLLIGFPLIGLLLCLLGFVEIAQPSQPCAPYLRV
jgi:hypothetical protein